MCAAACLTVTGLVDILNQSFGNENQLLNSKKDTLSWNIACYNWKDWDIEQAAKKQLLIVMTHYFWASLKSSDYYWPEPKPVGGP